jgi:trehalose 6-phosphate synthase/phosphatase
LLSLQTHLRVTWVGTVRYRGCIPEHEEEAVTRALRPLNCVPVFLDQETHTNFYQRWCKGVIWPVLHHIADIYGPSEQTIIGGQTQQDFLYWYTTVNQKFRSQIVEVYHEGDLIWIHGFHLMLLPSFLRKVVQVYTNTCLASLCRELSLNPFHQLSDGAYWHVFPHTLPFL